VIPLDRRLLVLVIHCAYIAVNGLYLLAVYVWKSFIGTDLIEGQLLETVFIVFSVSAMFFAVAGNYMPTLVKNKRMLYRNILSRYTAGEIELDSDEEKALRPIFVYVLRGGSFEVISVLGTILGIAGAELSQIYPFYLISFLMLFYTFPREADLKSIIEENWSLDLH
jgi:hypothetical protein